MKIEGIPYNQQILKFEHLLCDSVNLLLTFVSPMWKKGYFEWEFSLDIKGHLLQFHDSVLELFKKVFGEEILVGRCCDKLDNDQDLRLFGHMTRIMENDRISEDSNLICTYRGILSKLDRVLRFLFQNRPDALEVLQMWKNPLKHYQSLKEEKLKLDFILSEGKYIFCKYEINEAISAVESFQKRFQKAFQVIHKVAMGRSENLMAYLNEEKDKEFAAHGDFQNKFRLMHYCIERMNDEHFLENREHIKYTKLFLEPLDQWDANRVKHQLERSKIKKPSIYNCHNNKKENKQSFNNEEEFCTHEHDALFVSCGHACLCWRCYEIQKPKVCHVCKAHVEEAVRIRIPEAAKRCCASKVLENIPPCICCGKLHGNTVFYPCGHLCLCAYCLSRMKKVIKKGEKLKCPICGQISKKTIKLENFNPEITRCFFEASQKRKTSETECSPVQEGHLSERGMSSLLFSDGRFPKCMKVSVGSDSACSPNSNADKSDLTVRILRIIDKKNYHDKNYDSQSFQDEANSCFSQERSYHDHKLDYSAKIDNENVDNVSLCNEISRQDKNFMPRSKTYSVFPKFRNSSILPNHSDKFTNSVDAESTSVLSGVRESTDRQFCSPYFHCTSKKHLSDSDVFQTMPNKKYNNKHLNHFKRITPNSSKPYGNTMSKLLQLMPHEEEDSKYEFIRKFPEVLLNTPLHAKCRKESHYQFCQEGILSTSRSFQDVSSKTTGISSRQPFEEVYMRNGQSIHDNAKNNRETMPANACNPRVSPNGNGLDSSDALRATINLIIHSQCRNCCKLTSIDHITSSVTLCS